MSATVAVERRRMPWRGPTSTGVVPPLRSLLRWMYIVRVAIALAVFMAAALSWWRADLTQLLVASVSAIGAFGFTAVSVWWSHIASRRITTTFLYVQAVFDLLLVTAIVHIAGPTTFFAALYILVIAVNAVMMPFANGMLIALLAGMLYAADVAVGHPGAISATVLVQIAVYWLVALATGYLASRVRVAGAAHEAITAELRRVRLEATDILRSIKTGILTVGPDGRLVYANPTAQAILGIEPGGWLSAGGMTLGELAQVAPVLGSAVRETAEGGRRVLRREGTVSIGGRTFPIGVSTTAVPADDGGPPTVAAIFKDISDEKRMEALHLRAERLEAVAEIAASLAHEIKNPLASIRSAVEQLARSAPAGADEKVLAGLVLRESDRLSVLLSEFMDFSRVRLTTSKPLDLAAVTEGGILLARRHPDCPAEVDIRLEAAGRPVMLEGDEDLLHRVVFNLVLNAVQIAPRSTITVTVQVAEASAVPAGMHVDDARLLRVADLGPGVAPDILPRIFEPFVTGRPGGTGLGLAIVQRAVQAHRGVILCDSRPGEGTTFTILLPARSRAEEGV
jgi:two-component system sensor histidine kinase PilS (NtrC family)